MYDSWDDKYTPIILIDRLNELHGIDYTLSFIDKVDELIEYQHNGKAGNEGDEDLALLNMNHNYSSDTDKKESKEDYYSIKNKKLYLTWKGFNTYHSYVIEKMNIKQSNQ